MVVDENPDKLGASVGLERTLVVVEDSDATKPLPLFQSDLVRKGREAVRECEAARLGYCTGASTCRKRKSTCSREKRDSR